MTHAPMRIGPSSMTTCPFSEGFWALSVLTKNRLGLPYFLAVAGLEGDFSEKQTKVVQSIFNRCKHNCKHVYS